MSDLTLIGLGILALLILLFFKKIRTWITLARLDRLRKDVNGIDTVAKKDQPEALRLALVTAFKITCTVAPIIRKQDDERYKDLVFKSQKVLAGWVGTYSPYSGTEVGAIDLVMADFRNHDVNILKITELLFDSKYEEATTVVQDIKNAAICHHLLELIKAIKE